MEIVQIGSHPVRKAPFPNGPSVEILASERPIDGKWIAAAHVHLPPGSKMPPHAHGESEALITPLNGQVVLANDDQQEILEPGMIARIAIGEMIRVENATSEPVSLLAVFAPIDFINVLATWPITDPADTTQ